MLDKKNLLSFLKDLKKAKGFNSSCGICSQVVKVSWTSSMLLAAYWRDIFGLDLFTWYEGNLQNWDHYSDCCRYPVSHPSNICPEEGYYKETNKWVGEYGERRLELLQIMIDYVQYRIDIDD